MIKKLILFTLFCVTGLSSLMAQERTCATMDNFENRLIKNPGLAQKMAEIETFTKQKIKSNIQNRIEGSIITIPVVVHILHRNNTENINDAQIISQIDVLNEDFRRLNLDADNTWPQAADVEIQFCMAIIDPNGNSTTGITRKLVIREDWGLNDDMKRSSTGGVDAWNTSQYLNMWIVPKMTEPFSGSTILGYAQFPGGDPITDGVVIGHNFFGRTGAVTAPFNLGRTTTHEVGHFFNLRHIWGDGNCAIDDFVTDTPLSDAPNSGCAINHSSCGTIDMVQNYMDYSDDSCLNLFTQGQKNRIRTVVGLGGFRHSLALSNKCGGGSTEPTCNDGIQNGDETGVDCGGSCDECETSSCTGTIISSFPYNESFEGDIGDWSQDTNDDLDWIIRSGGTPSNETGPSSAVDGNSYLYVEASGNGTGYPNKQAIINSPCFDLTNVSGATFDFKYHMNGSNNLGSISLEASTDNSTWTILWDETSDQPNSWQDVSIDLGAYAGEVVKLRFNRVTGNTWQADVAIDGINIFTTSEEDCSNIQLSITFDDYPEETSWEILDANGAIVFSGGTYEDQADGSTINLNGCIDSGCYTLIVNDVFGDGMCCDFGNGSYSLTNTDSGVVLASGGLFTELDSTRFCIGGATEKKEVVDDASRTGDESFFDIKIYPNPVRGNLLNVTTNASKITYVITNMLGQEVAKGETTSKTVDVSELSKGNYIINIKTAKNKEVMKRFIRE